MLSIHRTSRNLAHLFRCGSLIAALCPLILWYVFPVWLANYHLASQPPFLFWGEISYWLSLSSTQRVLAFAADMLIACGYVVALEWGRQLFKQYSNNEFFSRHNAKVMGYCGLTLLLTQCASPFLRAAKTVILSWHNGAGHRVLRFDLGLSDVNSVVLAVILMLMAHIMKKASDMQEEQRQII